jgi:serine protease Do
LVIALIAAVGRWTLTQEKTAGQKKSPDVRFAPEQASRYLAELSAAFREVAKVARPSVVQVSAEARGPRRGMREFSFPGDEGLDTDELFRRFFGEEFRRNPYFPQTPRGEQPQEEGGEGQRGRRRGFEQYNIPQRIGEASGWIYDKQGHIVTNRHVVAGADVITVRFLDETEVEARIVGSDPQTDIAVLKVDKEDLTPAKVATEPVEPGDIVMAIGSPFEYAFSISQGIVSATGRRVGILGPTGYENFIQTDAAINPGNSGGPLINVRAEVVGMNTAIATRNGVFAGVGFAIPVEMIRDIAEKLIRTGKVQRGYLGAFISDDPQLLKSFGAETGVLVEDTIAGTPAEKAGLKAGDVVLQIDGRPVRSAAELRRMIADTEPGKTIQLEILRDRKRTSVKVKVDELPAQMTEPGAKVEIEQEEEGTEAGEALEKLGFQRLRTMTKQFAEQEGLAFHAGVVVLEVRPRSVAAAEGIREGDIITQVVGKDIETVEDLNALMEKQNLREGVRFRVRTPQGLSRFVLLKLERNGSGQ